MSGEQASETSGASNATMHERCVCNEVIDHLREAFGVSPEVKTHLNNSRIELLKAVRRVIDDRIERLSKPVAHGTKIAVE
ncbi:MAG TPA: hypothetical protein VJR23_10280 [Candidatus Acidoferrales bacterium]|nr:hypothetical protein [Candidatus Acidoferrales bacterium]